MIRTLISLDPDDKAWLDQAAAERGVPMSELVREAVRRFRAASDKPRPTFRALLDRTGGLWQAGDGLVWQDELRDEW